MPLVHPVRWYVSPFVNEPLGQLLVGYLYPVKVSGIQQVQAMSQRDSGLDYGSVVRKPGLRPLLCSMGTVHPEIDAAAQPIVCIGRWNKLFVSGHPAQGFLIAAMIGYDLRGGHYGIGESWHLTAYR